MSVTRGELRNSPELVLFGIYSENEELCFVADIHWKCQEVKMQAEYKSVWVVRAGRKYQETAVLGAKVIFPDTKRTDEALPRGGV